MTTFKYAIQQCGLSQAEAAAYFDVSLQSVKAWSTAHRTPPEGVWKMLAALNQQIRDLAATTAETIIEEGGEATLDHRAYNNLSADFTGFDELPCEGARNAAGALALLMVLSPDEWE